MPKGISVIKMVNSVNNERVPELMKGRDDMLKKTLKTALLSFAVFVSILMVAALVITTVIRNAAASASIGAYETKADGGYVLKSYNGHIAVFYGDIKDSPAIETTIDVTTLRSVDREKLEKGINVEKYDEVLKLLEDFGS
jgi:hypothetical protein